MRLAEGRGDIRVDHRFHVGDVAHIG
jgi:hypothetical protein